MYHKSRRQEGDNLRLSTIQAVREDDTPSAASLRGGGCPGMCYALPSEKEAMFTSIFKAKAWSGILRLQDEGADKYG